MYTIYKKKFYFSSPKEKVFSRFLNIIILDFNKNSTTLNSSLTNPIGMTFLYDEEHLGNISSKKAIITSFFRNEMFEYVIHSNNEILNISCDFYDTYKKNTKGCILSYEVKIKKIPLLFFLKKKKIIKNIKKKLESYIKYTKKVII